MCSWWQAKVVCASVVVLAICGTSARGESILQLHRASAAKTPAKTGKPAPSITVRDDSDFDGARFLLGGKKEQPTPMAAGKKKAAEPPVEWDQKHAKKVKLKGLPKKPPKPEPKHETSVQWAVAPTPMAPAAMEATSVPAPKAMWAGLSLMSLLGICRLWTSRRGLAN